MRLLTWKIILFFAQKGYVRLVTESQTSKSLTVELRCCLDLPNLTSSRIHFRVLPLFYLAVTRSARNVIEIGFLGGHVSLEVESLCAWDCATDHR